MSRPPRLPHTRGQATVELVLGLLVFVTVLLFGIHFAEVGMMKLRVQQAATAALWDTTGLRMHRFNTPTADKPDFYSSDEMRDASGRTPSQRAEARFRDFDGLSAGGAGSFTQVATRGSRLEVRCEPASVAPLRPSRGGEEAAAIAKLHSAYPVVRSGGAEVDGMACNARARLEIFGMPTHLFEGRQGFFSADHVLTPRIPVCAFGRASGGECRGSVPLALDDWALSGSKASHGQELSACWEDCLFNGKGNQAYKRTVERLYERYNAFDTEKFVLPDFIRKLYTENPSVPELNNVPVDERVFRLVFVGEDGPRTGAGTSQPFTYKTREQDTVRAIDFEWATTPYADAYERAYKRRRECFLGTPCERSLFAKETW
jgi:hypothetical protein